MELMYLCLPCSLKKYRQVNAGGNPSMVSDGGGRVVGYS